MLCSSLSSLTLSVFTYYYYIIEEIYYVPALHVFFCLLYQINPTTMFANGTDYSPTGHRHVDPCHSDPCTTL